MLFYLKKSAKSKSVVLILRSISFLLFSLPSHSQTIFRDSGEKEDPATLQKMYTQAFKIADSLARQKYVVSKIEILENGYDTYLFFDGRFDVYYWTGRRWVNQYLNKYHGYNFMSRKFDCKLSGIYSYGGYGFWTNHGHIIQFDSGLGKDWNLLHYSKNLPLAPMFSSDEENCIATIFADSIYKIDIPKQKFVSIQPNPHAGFFELKDLPNTFETEDFLVVTLKNAIIEKKTGNVILLRPLVLSALHKAESNNRALCYIHGNQILVDNLSNRTKDTFDVAALVTSGQILPQNTTEYGFLKPFLLVTGFVIPVFLAWFWFSRMRRNTSLRANTSAEPTDQISFKRLLPYSGKTLSVEQLDNILELTHSYPEESKRFKRFHLVKDINQSYKSLTDRTLITRQRDPHDGRRYVYFIQK